MLIRSVVGREQVRSTAAPSRKSRSAPAPPRGRRFSIVDSLDRGSRRGVGNPLVRNALLAAACAGTTSAHQFLGETPRGIVAPSGLVANSASVALRHAVDDPGYPPGPCASITTRRTASTSTSSPRDVLVRVAPPRLLARPRNSECEIQLPTVTRGAARRRRPTRTQTLTSIRQAFCAVPPELVAIIEAPRLRPPCPPAAPASGRRPGQPPEQKASSWPWGVGPPEIARLSPARALTRPAVDLCHRGDLGDLVGETPTSSSGLNRPVRSALRRCARL